MTAREKTGNSGNRSGNTHCEAFRAVRVDVATVAAVATKPKGVKRGRIVVTVSVWTCIFVSDDRYVGPQLTLEKVATPATSATRYLSGRDASQFVLPLVLPLLPLSREMLPCCQWSAA